MPSRFYDWDSWFALRRVVLTRGEQYLCSTASMVQQVRNAASKRGLHVTVSDDGDCVTITVHHEEEEVPA